MRIPRLTGSWLVSPRPFLRKASTFWKGVGGSRKRQTVTGSQKVNDLNETGCHMRSSSRLFVELTVNCSKGPPFSFNQVVFK